MFMENTKDREIVELKKRLIQYNDVLNITKNMNTELQKKNETLEIQNRQLDEDFCTLKDNHENLKKRFEILQKEIFDIRNKSNKKSSMFDWIINGSVKEQNELLREKLTAIEAELNIKILENEQIHMEIFEIKQNFNEKLKILECEIEKLKMSITDKISELNSVNEKNFQLLNNQRLLENNLNNITENLKKLENEFRENSEKWTIKKTELKDEIEFRKTYEDNLMPINEYKNFEYNIHNSEYAISNQQHLENIKKFKEFSSIFLQNVFTITSPIEGMCQLLIERFNFIYTNIELKTEYKGFLFASDKIRFHSFTFSQIIKTFGLFVKIFGELFNNFLNDASEEIYLNIKLTMNVILTLFNKSATYFSLITKYYKIVLKEERKITENFSNIDALYESEKHQATKNHKLNKNLNLLLSKLNSEFTLFVRKVNLLTNFDLEYHLKNIKIASDNTSGLFIKVSENYFKDFRHNSVMKNFEKLKMLERMFNKRSNNTQNTNNETQEKINSNQENLHDNCIHNSFSQTFADFIKLFLIKIEVDYKIFERIKEENKHKLNYPIINLSALKTNNDNFRKLLLELNHDIEEKIFDLIEKNISLFLIDSWQFPNRKNLISYLKLPQKFHKLKSFNKEFVKIYKLYEPGVDYETAIKNRAILKDLLEKENSQLRDRENFLTKMNEYEEDLVKFREKLSHEQNEKDLLRLKITELEQKLKSGDTSSIKNFNLSNNLLNSEISTNAKNSNSNTENSSTTEKNPNEFEEFEEFLKYQNQSNISEIFQEILSDDVESGTQRSTFKLFKFDKCIPVTNFTAQIENNDDVSVLYHRKVIEKLQRYSGKIKNFETKVLSNLRIDEIKLEYESKLDESVKKYEQEIDYLKKVVKQKEDNIFGYTEQILVLNSFANDLETLRDSIKDCLKCRKFI